MVTQDNSWRGVRLVSRDCCNHHIDCSQTRLWNRSVLVPNVVKIPTISTREMDPLQKNGVGCLELLFNKYFNIRHDSKGQMCNGNK